jgi:tetratricopeptide (TPR) repeat protein
MLALPFPPAAIETQNPEPLGVLLERARTARDQGRLAEAVQAYDAMLAQVPTHETALFERAETLGWAERYTASREGYLAFRKAYPAQALRADLALARLAAWQDRSGEALAILDPWVKQEQRQAILDAATYLSWSGRLPESLATVQRWLAAHPDDQEALLLEAKLFSWAGRNAEARQVFGRALSTDAGNREALVGLARLALWEGDTREARRIVARMPPEILAHPSAQVILAQVEVAEGQTRSGFKRAAALTSGGSAQREAEEVRDDLARAFGPWVELSTNRTDTSEGLRTENPSLQARVPLGDGALSLGGTARRSDFQGLQRQPTETNLGLSYPVGFGLLASGSLNRISNAGGEPAWGYALRLGYTPLPGLDLSLARERSFALFTPQAAELRTVFLATDLGATWRFGQGRHALGAGLGQADITSAANGVALASTRHNHTAWYEYRFPVTVLDVRGGVLTRGLGYSQTLPLGFFNPDSYRWSGAFGTATWRRGRILEVALGAQIGSQTVNGGQAQSTWSYRAGVTWTPQAWPADLSIWWAQSMAGLPVTVTADPSAYREHTLGLSLKIRGKAWIW